MPIIVEAHNLAYSPLPKAGCSTVKRMLAMVDPETELPPREEWSQALWHELYPTIRYKRHRFIAAAHHWRFCVVRDPFKRLMSVYTNRVVQFRDLHNSARLRKAENAHLPKDPDPDYFFGHLDEYVQNASVIKHHVLPAHVFLGPPERLKLYDRIYRTEELGQLAEDLSARTGQEIDIARENRSDMKLGLDDLAPETIDALRPRLAVEYTLLKDFFDNPLS